MRQIFSDGAFKSTTLAEHGLIVQLNHRRGSCARPESWNRDFTVIHTNGPHQVKISYCRCRSHIKGNGNLEQLFRERWLPATWRATRTAFTFDVLNSFHLINLQAKTNLYDYYQTLLRQVNNANLLPKLVRRVCVSYHHEPEQFVPVSIQQDVLRHAGMASLEAASTVWSRTRPKWCCSYRAARAYFRVPGLP